MYDAALNITISLPLPLKFVVSSTAEVVFVLSIIAVDARLSPLSY
jgi:hypothetical protein